MFSNRKSASLPAKSSLFWERACSSAWGNEPALDTFCPSGGGGRRPGRISRRFGSCPQRLPRHSVRASSLFGRTRFFLSAPRHQRGGGQLPACAARVLHEPDRVLSEDWCRR